MNWPVVKRPAALALATVVLTLAVLPLAAPHLPMELRGEEATPLLMATSLVHDGDLRLERADLERLFAARPFTPPFPVVVHPPAIDDASGDPRGPVLAGSVLYAGLAAPFVAAFGPPGALTLNVLLLGLAVALAWRRLGGDGRALLFAAGAVFASPALVHAYRVHPASLGVAIATAALVLGLPAEGRRPGVLAAMGSGLALAVVSALEPVALVLAVPIVVGLLLPSPRPRASLPLPVGERAPRIALLVAFALGVVGVATLEGVGPETTVLVEGPTDPVELLAADTVPDTVPDTATLGRTGPFRLVGLAFLGRFGGLLLYFPFVLVALLALGDELRARRWRPASLPLAPITLAPVTLAPVTLALVASLVVAAPLLLRGWLAEPGGLLRPVGNPHQLVLLAVVLVLLRRPPRPALTAAGYALAALLLGVPLLTVFGSPAPGSGGLDASRDLPFRLAPAETELLPRLAGYQAHPIPEGRLWTRTDQVTERGSLWVTAGEPVELWLERREPLRRPLALSVASYAPANTIDVRLGAHRETLTIEATQTRGAARRLRLPPPAEPDVVHRDAGDGGDDGGDDDGGDVLLYRLVVEAEAGAQPWWRGHGQSRDWAGAVLNFTGSPPAGDDAFSVAWKGCAAPRAVHAQESFVALAHLRNTSPVVWPTGPGARVRVGSHWYESDGVTAEREGTRADLPGPLPPGEAIVVQMRIVPPPVPGRYVLELEPIYEHVAWFSKRTDGAVCRMEVEVLPPRAD